MKWNFEFLIKELSKNNAGPLLKEGLYGLEKEMLRADKEGNLAITPHPIGLGSKLTNPEITTDFSESQIELITPPLNSIEEAQKYLEKLHFFTASKIENEYLWPLSMPCRLPENEEEIPIARYDDTAEGRKSEIYRKGLALRYGKYMQTISGVHYNRSFSEEFWKMMQSILDPEADLKSFINEGYLHLVRNFIRYRWLLVLFCGASPAKDDSYGCKNMNTKAKKPLSLRLSRCGYSNPAKVDVSYNSFKDYLNDLKRAVETPYPPYTELGLIKNGEQVQLNDHLLQIGNEYYFPIRLKPPKPYEDVIKALAKNGVEYIEVRIFDLNPFEPTGVNVNSLYFSDLFLMFCLMHESPNIDEEELTVSTKNQQDVAFMGQDFSIPLTRGNKDIKLKKWTEEILKPMKSLVTLLDKGNKEQPYSKAWEWAEAALKNPELLPAFRVIKEMGDRKENFIEYGLSKAKEYQQYFNSQP